jgi:hypothetical protein
MSWGAREKCEKIFLIEAKDAANSLLLASVLTNIKEIFAIFIRVSSLYKRL